MKLSMIIPTFNKLPRLKLMLTSALNQNFDKRDYEICVIDDGSCDGTEDFMKDILNKTTNVIYIKQSNQGRSTARNQGIQNTSGEVIIFIDDDIIIGSNFINSHLKANTCSKIVHGRITHLSGLKFYEDPTNGVFFQGLEKTNNKKGTLEQLCISQEDILYRFQEKIAYNKKISSSEWLVEKIFQHGRNDFYWLGFTGGNVSVPRTFLQKTGGFDEKFGVEWGFEDFELGYRLLKKGYQFEYDYDAIGYHIAHYRESSKIESDMTGSYFKYKQKDENVKLITEFVAGNIKKEAVLKKMLNF